MVGKGAPHCCAARPETILGNVLHHATPVKERHLVLFFIELIVKSIIMTFSSLKKILVIIKDDLLSQHRLTQAPLQKACSCCVP